MGEVSYFSRFFVKFVEILGAGLASAVSGLLIAHFAGVQWYSRTPSSAPILTTPTASEAARSLPAQPTPPVADPAVNEQGSAPQYPALKAMKDPKALPPPKHSKTNTRMVKKNDPGEKSIEILARAALANVDANRTLPIEGPIVTGPTDIRSRSADIQTRQADLPSRQNNAQRPPLDSARTPATEVPMHAADVQPKTVRPPPAVDADRQSVSPERAGKILMTPIDVQPRPDAHSPPPGVRPPAELAAPREPPPDGHRSVLSAVKRIPDLLRPDPPAPRDEDPRPPMPVGTPSPEIVPGM